jgi:DNA modification methylase
VDQRVEYTHVVYGHITSLFFGTIEGNIVLDPFMGSGTTGEAALNLKRRFIGIEVDKEHYSITKQRLSKLNFESDTCNVSMLAKNVQEQSKKEVKEISE